MSNTKEEYQSQEEYNKGEEENPEDYSPEYPNGDMAEPHDIEKDRELEVINEELQDLEAQQADLEPERRQEREAEESENRETYPEHEGITYGEHYHDNKLD